MVVNYELGLCNYRGIVRLMIYIIDRIKWYFIIGKGEVKYI